MPNDEVLLEDEALPSAPPSTSEGEARRDPPRKRRLRSLGFLVFGGLVALYLSKVGPQEQHVRVVLGASAPAVTEVDLQYVANDGEVVRETHFSYPTGGAPRVVAHELKLPNGDYRVQIDVDARDGRRAVQRQVTLGAGSTQIDVSSALSRTDEPMPP